MHSINFKIISKLLNFNFFNVCESFLSIASLIFSFREFSIPSKKKSLKKGKFKSTVIFLIFIDFSDCEQTSIISESINSDFGPISSAPT